ncbi:unnamed protein product [Miscanthus lutarioriparius]|uniref:Uncharacterized protein n=1 Tax=Miscanthus lutarioriparius TaxID=422564 RepID=A0A811PT92_9POAL|nr:unnamed protein product [Miscanthus lutarioriparius]
MQRSNSFGTSWADQWDYGGDPSPRARGRQQDGGGKKQGGVEKTKAAAATGAEEGEGGHGQRVPVDQGQVPEEGRQETGRP